jgi:hypothetical protein
MTMNYTSNGIPHKIRVRANYGTALLGGYYIALNGGGNISPQDAADQWFTLLAPLYKNGQATLDGWVLDKYDAGAYFPIDSGSTAVAPSDTSNTQIAQQVTLTFRDENFKKVRFMLMECRVTPAAKYPYSALGGAFKDLVDSLLAESSGNLGSWVCGRGDTPGSTFSFLSLVSTYNRKLRRRRGLA